MIVLTVEKNQVKNFAQNELGKIRLFYVQTAAWLPGAAINYVYLSLWSLTKDFFTI